MKRIKIVLFGFVLLFTTGINAQTHEQKTTKEKQQEVPKEKQEKKEEVKPEHATPVRKIKTEIRTQELLKTN